MSSGDAAPEAVGVRNLLAILWREKRSIVVMATVCTIAAGAYAFLATKLYRAEAVVQPRQDSRVGGGLGVLAAQYSGLADLTGISIGGEGGDAEVAIATLRARALIQPFILENGLLPKLYPDLWDAEAARWKDNDPDAQPSAWEAYNDFTKNQLSVLQNKKTGLVTVAIEWRNPAEAQQWVTDLIARTNALLKDKAIQEGERNLLYLQGQSKTTEQVELRQALFGLVESELKKLMLAKGGNEFAFKTIDPAVVPQKKVWPRRGLIIVFGLLLGLIVGVVGVLAREAWGAA